MNFKGEFRKMPAELDAESLVQYKLRLFDTATQNDIDLSLNECIGKDISIRFEGNIFCKKCGRKTKTSFNQGFCYNCFMTSSESAECIIRPELCRAHLGEGRDPQWEKEHHNQPHFVYLAASDVVKVGVTRSTQIPTRWIDQGASAAVKLAETPNRYEAGLIEVALKSSFTDKTNWQKMVKNEIDDSIDLEETKWQLAEQLPRDIERFISNDDTITKIQYPVLSYPSKVKSINLDKSSFVAGRLTGIKGQYWLLKGGGVFNVRKHTGYQVELTIE